MALFQKNSHAKIDANANSKVLKTMTQSRRDSFSTKSQCRNKNDQTPEVVMMREPDESFLSPPRNVVKVVYNNSSIKKQKKKSGTGMSTTEGHSQVSSNNWVQLRHNHEDRPTLEQ